MSISSAVQDCKQHSLSDFPPAARAILPIAALPDAHPPRVGVHHWMRGIS